MAAIQSRNTRAHLNFTTELESPSTIRSVFTKEDRMIARIRAVAGEDYETAVIPEEQRKYLSHYDAKSVHYEIASIHTAAELSSIPS